MVLKLEMQKGKYNLCRQQQQLQTTSRYTQCPWNKFMNVDEEHKYATILQNCTNEVHGLGSIAHALCINSVDGVKHGPSGAVLVAGHVQRVTGHLLRHPVVSWVSQAAD